MTFSKKFKIKDKTYFVFNIDGEPLDDNYLTIVSEENFNKLYSKHPDIKEFVYFLELAEYSYPELEYLYEDCKRIRDEENE